MNCSRPRLAFLVFSALMAGAGSGASAAEGDQFATQTAQPATSAEAEPAPQDEQPSDGALEQIVAPIAMYPDGLVAQILTAATNPAEIVEADRWMQQGSSLDEAAFGEAVDQQAWDPSVKALTQFPSILANMDQNLSWTTALGDAYASQPQALLDAIQVLRKRAEQAGTLKSTPQEAVTTEGDTIVIEPASPDYVYVPEYDPWLAYGPPIDTYPNWDPYPGLFLDGPGNWFDPGVGIGVFGGFAWGWHHWRSDWHDGRTIYHNNPYIARRPPFTGGHDLDGGHAGFASNNRGFHVIEPHAGMGFRPDRFSGFGHAGVARSSPFTGQHFTGQHFTEQHFTEQHFTGRISGGVPAGGFHGGPGGFHGGPGGFHGGVGGGHR
jgi:hypothetical protein